MHLTTKQSELLRVISAGNGLDMPADLDEILERVRYETSKQSLQFSIRALIAHGLIFKKGIEKRRGRQRQVIEATGEGHAHMRVAKDSAAAVSEIIEGAEMDSAVFDDFTSGVLELLE